MRLLERSENRQALAPLLKVETDWWPGFVGYVATNAARLEILHGVFEIQPGGPSQAPPDALRAYLRRLQDEGFWLESYFVWLNSLDAQKLRAAGNVYNGGFEEPISNLGFDWQVSKTDAVLIQTAPSFGATGGKALQLVFRGPRVRFRHVSQLLMLPGGNYLLRGRVRPESFEAPQGLNWAVYCAGEQEPLITSERFVGTDQWRRFASPFTVPAKGCAVQLLRLELAGRVALDFDAKGGIWFDDMQVERQALD